MVRRRRPFRDLFGFGGFGDIFDEMDRMMEEFMESFRGLRPGELREGEPMVYGWSMEVGPDGIPRIQEFGNVRPTRGGFVERGVREPFTSTMIDEENDVLRITAELPGVSKEDINLSATENSVTIEAKTKEGERKYYKVLTDLPEIDPDSAEAMYNNGVLEVTFKLKERPERRGKRIEVK
jgi:HSP20 family protein